MIIVSLAYYLSSGSATVRIINGTEYTIGASVAYHQGQNVSNFFIQTINQENVTGLIYIRYPVATTKGMPKTLRLFDTVGYNCDGTLRMLTSIGIGLATFTDVSTGKSPYGCPI